MDANRQVESIANTKNAARFDLKTVHITNGDGVTQSVVDAAEEVLAAMKEFFRGFGEEVLEVLDFELDKFLDMHNRYAWQVRERFSDGFVKKGLEFCT